ncbi:MAG: hypothetical protein ACRDYA_22645 [Egibacteraceae bacterium]
MGLVIVVIMTAAAVYGAIKNSNVAGSSIGTSPTKTIPGGLWISPISSGFEVNGNMLYLAAHAYPTNDGDPPIDHVNFTATWPSAGGNWIILCAPSQPAPGSSDWYECTLDLSKVRLPKTGQLTVSFDVYDRAGNRNLAPNGLHQGLLYRSLHLCNAVKYVKNRFGLSDTVNDDTNDIELYLQHRRFHQLSAPQTGAVAVFQPFFNDLNQSVGYVAVIDSVHSLDDNWQISALGSGTSSSSQITDHNCTNVSNQSWLYPKSSTTVSYWTR